MQNTLERCEDGSCEHHFHSEEDISSVETFQRPLAEKQNTSPQVPVRVEGNPENSTQHKGNTQKVDIDLNDRGVRRIIRNFTPSYVALPAPFVAEGLLTAVTK